MNQFPRRTMDGRAPARRLPVWLRVIAMILLVFTGLMLYVWKNVKVTQLAKECSTLKKQREYLVNENRALTVTITALSQMSRVEQIAREELGLQYPEAYPVVFKMAAAAPSPRGLANRFSVRAMTAFVRHTRQTVLPEAEADLLNRE
jgi:cell division protein FtsL